MEVRRTIENYFRIVAEYITLEGKFEKKHLAVEVKNEYSVVAKAVRVK